MILALLFAGVATTTAFAQSIEGQVVGVATGKPIGGAAMVASWASGGQVETETDGDGRFKISAQGGSGSPDASLLVYRCGYLYWSNLEVFDRRDHAIGGFFRPREDKSIPPQIRLQRFPADGNLARQVAVAGWLLNADGMPQRRPKLLREVSGDAAKARTMCGTKCQE